MSDLMCPVCKETGSRVLDSRINKRGHIRRRRKCLCGTTFSTYEMVEGDYEDQLSRTRSVAVLERAVSAIEREILLLTSD